MAGWVTEEQAGRGLHPQVHPHHHHQHLHQPHHHDPQYLYNAITGNWERKRPVGIYGIYGIYGREETDMVWLCRSGRC